MDELAVLFLKTYQVWHHRRLLVSLTQQPKRELDFIRRGLEADAKNYHTWSYRQWLLGSFAGRGASVTDAEGDVKDVDEDLWIGELDFVDTMLAQDVRNNSAWHHRFFVVWGCGVREGDEDRERVLKRELTYVFFLLFILFRCSHLLLDMLSKTSRLLPQILQRGTISEVSYLTLTHPSPLW